MMPPGYPENIQGRSFNILNYDGKYDSNLDVDVPTTNVATSEPFFLPRGSTFGWEVQFESDGAINVKVELQQRFEEDDDWVIPDDHADDPMFTAVTDSNTHQNAYAPIASLWGRLKLTGLGSNDVTTTLTKAKMYVARNYG